MKEKVVKKSSKRILKKKIEEVEGISLKKVKKFNKKLAVFVFFTLFVLVLGFLAYLNAGLFLVALVNNKPVWRTELIKQLEKQGGKQVTDMLVNKLLIYQEASKKGVSVSEQDVEAEYKKLEDQFKSQGTSLQDVMALQGLKESDLKEELEFSLLLKKLLADKVAVSDDEAKDYFNKNKEMFEKGKTFDELKEQIKSFLSNQKMSQSYQSFLEELKSSSKIRYFVNFN